MEILRIIGYKQLIPRLIPKSPARKTTPPKQVMSPEQVIPREQVMSPKQVVSPKQALPQLVGARQAQEEGLEKIAEAGYRTAKLITERPMNGSFTAQGRVNSRQKRI